MPNGAPGLAAYCRSRSKGLKMRAALWVLLGGLWTWFCLGTPLESDYALPALMFLLLLALKAGVALAALLGYAVGVFLLKRAQLRVGLYDSGVHLLYACLLALLIPAGVSISEPSRIRYVEQKAQETLAALQRFQQDSGTYPGSLRELIPGYLDRSFSQLLSTRPGPPALRYEVVRAESLLVLPGDYRDALYGSSEKQAASQALLAELLNEAFAELSLPVPPAELFVTREGAHGVIRSVRRAAERRSGKEYYLLSHSFYQGVASGQPPESDDEAEHWHVGIMTQFRITTPQGEYDSLEGRWKTDGG